MAARASRGQLLAVPIRFGIVFQPEGCYSVPAPVLKGLTVTRFLHLIPVFVPIEARSASSRIPAPRS